MLCGYFFFFKQKTAYEMRISDWSSDVCSSDLLQAELTARDDQRLAAWNASLGGIAGTLRQQWEEVGVPATGRHQQICDTLAQTAQAISAQTPTQARDPIADVAQLAQAAPPASSELRRVGIEVVVTGISG